jgi:hypothetical protein
MLKLQSQTIPSLRPNDNLISGQPAYTYAPPFRLSKWPWLKPMMGHDAS